MMDSLFSGMVYSVDQLIFAFINLAIVICDTAQMKGKIFYGHRILRLLTLCYILNLFGALQWIFTDGRTETGFVALNWFGCALTVLMPLAFSCGCALYVDYAIERNPDKLRRYGRIYRIICWGAVFIFFVSTPTGMVFSIDAEAVYRRGPWMGIFFLAALAVQARAVWKLLRRRRLLKEGKLDFYALLLICGIVSCGFARQWTGNAGELMFYHSIALCAMFFKVNHDESFEKEKLYKTTMDNCNVGIAIYDANDRYEYANRRYLQDTNFAAEALDGSEVDAYLKKNVIGRTRCETLSEERFRMIDIFYKTYGRRNFQGVAHFGEAIYFVTLVEADVLEETYRVVFYNDITNDRRVRNELERKIRRTGLYETAFERANYGVSIFSSDEKIVYINKFYANLVYRKEPGDLIGGDVYLPCTTPEKIAKWRSAFRDAVERRTGQIVIPIAGRPHSFSYEVVTVRDTAAGDENYICLLQDITENKYLEEKIADQLQRLKQLSKAKDEFIANVSHEIRTPINAILGMLYFMKNTILSREQIDYINKIDNAANVLLALINDVLDFSKFSAKKIHFNNEPFKIRSVVESVKTMFEMGCKGKGIELRAHFNFDGELAVNADKVRFSQVVMNFVSNAVKFTSRGAVDIYVELQETNDTEIALKLSVVDTGIGIAPENLQRIWNTFEQVDSSLNKSYEGTGLGLAISRQIVLQMGGRIWAESKMDEGSAFRFTVKMQRSVADCLEEATKPAQDCDLSGCRVLLVEDNEINAEIAGSLLKQMGLSYDTAADGAEAVECCAEHPKEYYNLILMDIHMPRMNGYEAAVKIRDVLGLHVPIIALSAADEDEEKKAQYASYIEGYLMKPIQPVVLKEYLACTFARFAASVPKAAKPEAKNGDLREICSVDAVLEQLGGNEALLRHLLIRFKIENEHVAGKIRHYYFERDGDQLLVVLNHLQNSTRNLGLKNVEEAVEHLLWAIKNDAVVEIDPYVDTIQQSLHNVFRAIR